MSEEQTEETLDEIEAVVVDDQEADTVADSFAETGTDLTEGYSVNGILTVPIEVVVSVGKAKPLIKDFLNMRRDSLLVLDSKIDDPVEIRVAGRPIARGELQEVPDQEGVLAVRLTEIVTHGEN